MAAIFTFYGYWVFFYSLSLMVSYVMLIRWAHKLFKKTRNNYVDPFMQKVMADSPYTPGVSIIAPAYNEENTIVGNVTSLLNQDYPKFELIIVNDGSKDKTLENLIENFQLVEVPFDYVERIKTRPFRRCFKSTNHQFRQLTVVDKENGGTKADASNAGVNVAKYPYFVCTDADCILDNKALFHCIKALMLHSDVIAVSGNMNMVNGCDVENGKVTVAKPSLNPIPLFQSLEYLRSFLVGKMGWSAINAIPNVSGGFGLFDKSVAISAGGYRGDSFAEDEDMIIRMVGHCCETNKPYRIVQVPEICCWTEAPSSLRILHRQRVRWGRGLIQTLYMYRSKIFNRRYGRMGMIALPFQTIFEFMAPIVEVAGFVMLIYLALTNGVNWEMARVITATIYIFSVMLASVTIYFDYRYSGIYTRKRSYFWLVLASFFEPVIYHPFIVFFSLKGYWNYISNRKAEWGEMTRKGFAKKTPPQPATTTPTPGGQPMQAAS